MRFVNPRNDLAFKKIFGDEQRKEILISFLNAVLDLPPHQAIVDITILNPYQVPPVEILKYSLLDIQATDQQGNRFIIEMQIEYVAAFLKRFLYYTARAYTDQIKPGDDYNLLQRVIFIGVLDYSAFAEDPHYLNSHVFLNRRTHSHLLRDLEFHFIELPKFTLAEHELVQTVDKWIYFIKHAADLAIIPESADFAALRSAYEVANQFSWSEADLQAYEKRWIMIHDERSRHRTAEERGRERGLQEGVVLGEARRSQEIARQMLAEGMDHARIARLTGVSSAERAILTTAAQSNPCS
ncbi:MAG: Rpn family recombination-promoting nuclease/putative transposase [Chloroflexaceae bacterium]|nr:Rpn family recombination-promoting nuclease/putative transposase [Chloroflexaceae bacterium]